MRHKREPAEAHFLVHRVKNPRWEGSKMGEESKPRSGAIRELLAAREVQPESCPPLIVLAMSNASPFIPRTWLDEAAGSEPRSEPDRSTLRHAFRLPSGQAASRVAAARPATP